MEFLKEILKFIVEHPEYFPSACLLFVVLMLFKMIRDHLSGIYDRLGEYNGTLQGLVELVRHIARKES